MSPIGKKRKTPRDATEFEREQLRFFLSRDDLSNALAEINPSIAWLPWLAETKLLQPATQLADWIERNFPDPDGVRDVAANIHYFDARTADVLEVRLNRLLPTLSPLLMKSWRLIIRHMRTAQRGALPDEWFDIVPLVKRGEVSHDVLQRLTNALTPKLTIGKRIAWPSEEADEEPEQPSDLMAIDYEVESGLDEDEVLTAWPQTVAPEIELRLLRMLSDALEATLADAIDVGVESNQGYGTSDSDVPSVAKHGQNTYRAGFLPIVRVMAELWTTLIQKDKKFALQIFERWQASEHRLIRRLALFAATHPAMYPSDAAALLLSIPLGEMFVTNSTVEVYRLLQSRWRDFSADQRRQIEERIAKGPPADWFREDADKSSIIDRCRFDLLGELQRAGLELTNKSNDLLKDIKSRWPKWELRPPEQAGFHIWHESSAGIVGDPDQFNGVSDEDLVKVAQTLQAEADFMQGDAWQALCQDQPERALRGLAADARKERWLPNYWNSFLWAAGERIKNASADEQIADLLQRAPLEAFVEVASPASWWLEKKAKTLSDDLLWPLWDRIADSVPRRDEEVADE